MARADVSPIGASDLDTVAQFFHTELNPRVPVNAWLGLLDPPWGATGPNRGFQVRVEGVLVGAYAAVYSTRQTAGHAVEICNLAAFCVQEEHRMHSIRLVRALLAQRGYVFTDLSPSGNVVAMNERLGFRHLDTATRLTLNLPRPPRRGIRVSDDPARLRTVLRGPDADAYKDHVATGAARHVIIERGDTYAYLVFRAVSRRGVRAFAAPLYASGDQRLLADAWGQVRAHLLRRGLAFTLAERRILGLAHGIGVELARPRPKMVRGGDPADDATLDYLYSELALLDW